MKKPTISAKVIEQSKEIFKNILNDTIIDKYIKLKANELSKDFFYILTEETAIFLSEYLPDYYSFDYMKHVGEWIYISFYGDPVTHYNELKKIIIDNEDDISELSIIFNELESEKEYLINRFWNDNETIKFEEGFYISCLLSVLNSK